MSAHMLGSSDGFYVAIGKRTAGIYRKFEEAKSVAFADFCEDAEVKVFLTREEANQHLLQYFIEKDFQGQRDEIAAECLTLKKTIFQNNLALLIKDKEIAESRRGIQIICSLCNANKLNTALDPCGHTMCDECAAKCPRADVSIHPEWPRICPFCKQKARSNLKIFV